MMNGTLLAFLGSSHVHVYNVTDVRRPSLVTRTLPQSSLIRLKRILTNSVAQKRKSNGFRFFWSCTRNLMKYITHNFRLQTESQVRESRCLNTFVRVASEVKAKTAVSCTNQLPVCIICVVSWPRKWLVKNVAEAQCGAVVMVSWAAHQAFNTWNSAFESCIF